MEIDYGAVFDVEVPETTTGAEETEIAAPSEETGTTTATAQGAEEQEAAAPAVEGEEDPEQPQTEVPEQEPKTDRDAQFAAARRKAEAERDAAIAQAKEDAQKQVDEFFKNSGLMNPYTGQPITTRAEYEAYRERFEADQKAKLMEKAGITQEEFQAFVQGLPEVRAARQAKAEAEAAARQAREQEAKARVDEQLRQIQAIDPTVKELGDLAKLDTYPKLYDMVKRGYSILDAYRLANYDTLTQRAAEASRKAAINSVQSKQHLKATESRGGGAIPVPDSVLEEYRALNPGATKEEIQKHYQSYMKNSRKEQ
ncbi:MAG: hypothetical protein ACLSEZ_15670 [Flavonifractor plautii]|uniref:hypothetical protein n=1 Tax=Flavonifractor plautii TaxID=292800 RepID=UPI00192502CE|nr:hypothetical protein [Flavonifractor plautii]MDC0821909.1 hypothetical protein [Flavonifractor plautii]